MHSLRRLKVNNFLAILWNNQHRNGHWTQLNHRRKDISCHYMHAIIDNWLSPLWQLLLHIILYVRIVIIYLHNFMFPIRFKINIFVPTLFTFVFHIIGTIQYFLSLCSLYFTPEILQPAKSHWTIRQFVFMCKLIGLLNIPLPWEGRKVTEARFLS